MPPDDIDVSCGVYIYRYIQVPNKTICHSYYYYYYCYYFYY